MKHSKFNLYFILTNKDGNSEKLIKRLVKFQKKSNQRSQLPRKLSQFLSPTLPPSADTRPPIIEEYAATAKSVDRFNALLAVIEYPHAIRKYDLLCLINCLSFTVVNSWVIWTDIKQNRIDDNHEESLKQFFNMLINEFFE